MLEKEGIVERKMVVQDKERKLQFNGWNLLFIAVYFLNMGNMGGGFRRNHANPILDIFLILPVQLSMIALLLFSRNFVDSIITLVISELFFRIAAIMMGFNILYHLILGFAIMCLVSLVHGLLREKLLERKQGKKTGGILLVDLALSSIMMIPLAFLYSNSIVNYFGPFSAFFGAWTFPTAFLILNAIFNLKIKKEKHFYHPVLTHHMIEEKDHAVKATLGNFSVYFCTRCTGMLIGIGISIYTFITFNVTIEPFTALIMNIFIPMPIFIDWGSQRLGFRKSTTASRLATGALTGLGMYFITFTAPEYSFWSAIILGIYFALLFIIYFVSARMGYYDEEDIDDLDDLDELGYGELNTKG